MFVFENVSYMFDFVVVTPICGQLAEANEAAC